MRKGFVSLALALLALAAPAVGQIYGGSGLPSPKNHSGEFLTNNGSKASWAGIAVPSVSLLDSNKPGGTYHSQKNEYLSWAGHAKATLLSATGSGYVSSLWFGMTTSDSVTRQTSILKLTVDGAVVFEDRFCLFFAAEYAWNTNPFISEYFGANQDFSGAGNTGAYTHVPIPFASSVVIELTNSSAGSATLWSVATYNLLPAGTQFGRTAHLKMSSGTLTGLVADQVVTLLDVSGLQPGRLLGLYLSFDDYPGNVNPRFAPLEGNVKFYLDGASTPDYESSGTEDYFQMSLYFANIPSPTVSPFLGMTLRNGNTINAYRLHIPDPVYFENAMKITWNCGDSAQKAFTGTERLAYTVWYYTQ